MHNIIDLEVVRYQISRKSAEEDLYEFVKQAWPIIEPGVPFVPGWHLGLICEHLTAITDGEITRLLINIPPRHAKSSLVSVLWPCWEWIRRPDYKYLTASYSATLSIRDNLKARRLIQSPWYQERWGKLYQLTDDQNQKIRFENNKSGYRIATSVGGSVTGDGGNRLTLDDAHGSQDAQSDAMRETAIEWFDQVWSTRLNNPKTDAMITIMQRLHEGDVSGRILSLGGWEHLCLPAEYDGVKRSTRIEVNYDPRTEKGELLWPDRFGKKEIDQLKLYLGEYGVSGQLQQSPSPPGGGILRTSHFQLWLKDWELPKFEYIIQSYDTAFTEKTAGDPSACTVWGVFEERGKRGVMLLDAWSEHLGYPALRAKVIEEWGSVYGKVTDNQHKRGRKPDVILIEAKASGQSLLQDLRQSNIPCIPYNPGNADKINRAHQVAPILELDCIWIPESRKNAGKFVTWSEEFVAQVEKFPNSEHDDFTDTLTAAMILLRDQGRFELQYAKPDIIEEADYSRKTKVNPYAA